MLGINISEMVEKYITQIGAGLAKQNNVSPNRVSVVIVFRENGTPAISFMLDGVHARWLTNEEIEKLCS